MAELQRHIKVTNNELKYTDPGSDKWIKLSRELKATKDRLKELSDQSAATQGALGKLSKIRVGTIAVIHSVSSAVRGVSKAIGTIADFEQANANLSTIIGKNVDDIGMLTESAKQLGATTEYTASQVTFLQTELAKLGFKENGVVMLSKIEKFLVALKTIGNDRLSGRCNHRSINALAEYHRVSFDCINIGCFHSIFAVSVSFLSRFHYICKSDVTVCYTTY